MSDQITLDAAAIDVPGPEDFEILARLFDEFRAFYERPSDRTGARAFVRELLAQGVTRFFVAKVAGEIAGFVHLVPYLDTLAMRKAWILEDLFVVPAARRCGAGGALLRYAEAFARADGANRLSLTTAHTNLTAQRVYVAHGYERDDIFRTYHRTLD